VELAQIHVAVRRLFADGPTEPTRTAAALALAVGLEDPASPLLDLEPRQVRFEVSSAWRSYFWALAQRHPAIVFIEDLHWAGAAMLDLLEELTDRVEAPVMFLGTARRELTTTHPGGGAGWRNFSGIMLEPLGATESARLLGLLLEGAQDQVPTSVRDRILERAGGHHFFIEQIIDHLGEERLAAGGPA